LDAINSHIPAVVQWRRLITVNRNKRVRLIYSNEVIDLASAITCLWWWHSAIL